jgi:hypothetical protein
MYFFAGHTGERRTPSAARVRISRFFSGLQQ